MLMMLSMNKQNRRDGLARTAAASRWARRISAAAKAGIAAILAVGLFAWSPWVPQAQAIDVNANAVNASLVFPPTFFGGVAAYESPNPYADICAWNLTNETVNVIFKMEDLFTGT